MTFLIVVVIIFIMDNKINEIIKENINTFSLPRYHEIPDVGLFLEQTVRLVNGYLVQLGGFELTNSMISNYVKQGLVASPVKKEYHREQIAAIIFIAIMKPVLSLEELKRCFALQQATYPLDVAYNYMCAEFENILQYVFGIKKELEKNGTTNSEAKTLFQNMITTVVHKIHLAKYLNEVSKTLEVEKEKH